MLFFKERYDVNCEELWCSQQKCSQTLSVRTSNIALSNIRSLPKSKCFQLNHKFGSLGAPEIIQNNLKQRLNQIK